MTPRQLQERLLEHFPDVTVEVTDLTGTQNHYQVLIVTSAFEGLRQLKRQRTVNGIFATELADGTIHAFAMNTYTPDEWKAKQTGGNHA